MGNKTMFIITSSFCKIPDNANELQIADDEIRKIKSKFHIVQQKRIIDDNIHSELFENTVRILDYVGKLSEPLFEIGNKLESQYFKEYKESPKLAKKLWLEHYDEITHPYDLRKNRCFRILDELDEEYFKIKKKNPANWNI